MVAPPKSKLVTKVRQRGHVQNISKGLKITLVWRGNAFEGWWSAPGKFSFLKILYFRFLLFSGHNTANSAASKRWNRWGIFDSWSNGHLAQRQQSFTNCPSRQSSPASVCWKIGKNYPIFDQRKSSVYGRSWRDLGCSGMYRILSILRRFRIEDPPK